MRLLDQTFNQGHNYSVSVHYVETTVQVYASSLPKTELIDFLSYLNKRTEETHIFKHKGMKALFIQHEKQVILSFQKWVDKSSEN